MLAFITFHKDAPKHGSVPASPSVPQRHKNHLGFPETEWKGQPKG